MTQDFFVKLSLNNPLGNEPARTNMLKQQIRTSDVLNDELLKLFFTIPREDFVPAKFKPLAFADITIPLARGQSMMTPREEAKILQELAIQKEERVLVLGVESGYLVTLIAHLASHVYYLDNELESFEQVERKINKYKVDNVTPIIGNIHQGWQDWYPFNVIILTGSLPSIPDTLKNALSIKGRLFTVVGKAPVMEAMIITRLSENTWRERKVFETDRPRLLDVKEPETFVF